MHGYFQPPCVEGEVLGPVSDFRGQARHPISHPVTKPLPRRNQFNPLEQSLNIAPLGQIAIRFVGREQPSFDTFHHERNGPTG